MTPRLAVGALLLLALLLVMSYVAWPWVQLALDPRLKHAEAARKELRVGQPLDQVFLVAEPFLGTSGSSASHSRTRSPDRG